MRCVLPLTMLSEQITGKAVKVEYNVDSDACRKGIANYRNSLMKYLNKTRDIHLCWLHEQTTRKDTALLRVDTDKNVSDIFTKPISVESFVIHREALGVMRVKK